jgi:hypothetical protein
MWKIQVLVTMRVQEGIRIVDRREWHDLRPTGGKPYTFDTKEKALEMRRMCYPGQTEKEVGVIEIK